MTKDREMVLRSAQRKMLRKIVKVGNKPVAEDSENSESESSRGTGERSESNEEEDDEDKRPKESWVQWIIRATRCGEHEMKKARVVDWNEEQRRRKWRWGGHVARRTDGRWSTAVLSWTPAGGKRRVGGQLMRWADAIDKVVVNSGDWRRGEWQTVAMDREEWKRMEEVFVQNG